MIIIHHFNLTVEEYVNQGIDNEFPISRFAHIARQEPGFIIMDFTAETRSMQKLPIGFRFVDSDVLVVQNRTAV